MYFLFRNSLDYKKKYYFLVKLILNDKSKTSINEILKKSCKIKDFRELSKLNLKKRELLNNFVNFQIKPYQIKNIYDYFLNQDSLIYAQYFRELYINSLITEMNKSKYLFDNNLTSYFEINSALDTLNLIKKSNLKYTSKKLLLEISAICHLISNNKDSAYKLWQKNFNQNDFQYLDYIKGKNIAVVGPAPTEEFSGSEIEGFDIIIRPIFTSTEKFDQKKFGKRTDISYYNYGFFINCNETLVVSSKELKWANLKPHKLEKKKLQCNSRFFNMVDTIYLSGDGNSIPNIVFDLLRFETNKIKLFSSTLYQEKKTFADDFSNTYFSRGLKKKQLINSIRNHDPLSQFNFLKKGFVNKLFIADVNSSNTLKLTCNEYLYKLVSM